MRIYLDNCCFNRPFDDQSLIAVRLETEVKLDIQEKIKSGSFSLGWSYILDFENDANPFLDRRIEIQKWKKLVDSFISETPEIFSERWRMAADALTTLHELHVFAKQSLASRHYQAELGNERNSYTYKKNDYTGLQTPSSRW